nr:MAG TPA: hypothetical protein [Caudoviricetes sp.]
MADETLLLTGSITKNSPDNPKLRAKDTFKKAVNIGEAIVSILSNTGIAGFKFHVPTHEQVNMESDITDHYIDTNSPVQDHIARRSVTITLQGYQGEYFYSVNPIEDMLAKVIPTMSLVKQFLPKLPDSTKQNFAKKYQEWTGIDTPEALKSTGQDNYNRIDLFKIFQDLYKLKSEQTKAFFFFQAMWQSEALFTVETSWKRYDNMVIQKLTPQRDNNADITDFSITFKQISKTTSKVESVENAAGRLKAQNAQVTEKGIDKGKEVSII